MIDQPYLTSWNNKQAPRLTATRRPASSTPPIYRSQLLDNNIHYYLQPDQRQDDAGRPGQRDGHRRHAGPARGRGPALRAEDHRSPERSRRSPPRSPSCGPGWPAARIGSTGSSPARSGNYDQSDAIRIMDAWWPLLVQAEFGPVLGSSAAGPGRERLPDQRRARPRRTRHGTPSTAHLGSAFDVGFYGIVQKDLRAVLRQQVPGPLNRVYCGTGSLARVPGGAGQLAGRRRSPSRRTRSIPADGVCQAGDQMCSDSIQFRAIGAITQPLIEWVNRPPSSRPTRSRAHRTGLTRLMPGYD